MPPGQVAAGGHPLDPQQSDRCWGSDITPLETLMGGSSTVSSRKATAQEAIFASLRSESEHHYCFGWCPSPDQ